MSRRQLAWVSAKNLPYEERLLSSLTDLCTVSRLNSISEFSVWAETNPMAQVIVRSYFQYDMCTHEIIEKYRLKSLNSLFFLRIVSNRKKLFCTLTGSKDVLVPEVDSNCAKYIIKPICPYDGEFIMNNRQNVNTEKTFLQQWIPNSGPDIKVYVVFDEVFAFTRPSSLTSAGTVAKKIRNDKARRLEKLKITKPWKVTPEIQRAALALRHSLKGDIFGFDMVQDKDGKLFVIDVNSFPSMFVVPGIADIMIRHIRGWIADKPDS